MASALTRALDALTDPGRREVLENLARGPCTVAELALRLAAPASVLHQWLGALREAGLVAEIGG
ncbi:MAG: ArsR/SmtB family transcription factor, partial [Candidatus Dormibacteria bacterium]